MNKKTKAADARVELVNVLREAAAPLSLGEVSERLGLPFRPVAYLLTAAISQGSVDRLEGGRYALSQGGQERMVCLGELLEFVLACEADWRLDDKLAALDRYAGPRQPVSSRR
jgi:hypothetical protein